MKKVIVEVDEALLIELSNAMAAYGDVCIGIIYGTEVSHKFDMLKQLPQNEIERRFKALKEFYFNLEKALKE